MFDNKTLDRFPPDSCEYGGDQNSQDRSERGTTTERVEGRLFCLENGDRLLDPTVALDSKTQTFPNVDNFKFKQW